MTRLRRSALKVSWRRIGGFVLVGVIAWAGAYAGVATANHTSSDVPTSSFFHDEIAWLTDNAIANGFPNGTFKPNDPIKRQQLALWLSNYNRSLRLSTGSTVVSGSPAAVNASAACSGTERAIAGGGSFSNTDAYMTASRPSFNGQSWTVSYEKEGVGLFMAGQQVDAWALCAPREIPA